jgi:hypothetical protein
MSEATEFNLTEMIAGDGAALSMPPAFVFVNPRSQRRYKKANQQAAKIDGRTKSAKNLLSRISKRKKMKEELEQIVAEAAPSETERAQKQIGQMKKLNRQKDLQKQRDEAKKKMQSKTAEMNVLMKARLADFKKKASEQQKKVQQNSYEPEGEMMIEQTTQMDALEVALEVATSELNPTGETTFAKITFDDGTQQNLDNFSAKRIAAAYSQLDDGNKEKFRYMLNKDAVTFQSALEFAVRNV